MTKQILFRIWVIGIYLEFGAWDLVLPFLYAFCVLFLLRESIKNHTGYHTEETNEEGDVKSLSGVGMINSRKEFDHPPQKGHEDGCTCHGEEIDPSHDRG